LDIPSWSSKRAAGSAAFPFTPAQIPSKTPRETVLNLTGWRERGFYGSAYRVKQDSSAKDLMARLHMTLDHEVDVLEHQFARNKVQTINGVGRFLDPHTIEIAQNDGDVRAVSGDKIIIAVGIRPYRPADVPFNATSVFDSDEIVEIPRLPRSLTGVGGGVIGVEYATISSALDVSVALIESRPSLLEFIDNELVEDFTHQLRDRGMAGDPLRRQGRQDRVLERLAGYHPGKRPPHSFGDALYAAGRVGATDTLNLQSCGLVADERGRLKVDPVTFQRSVPHIYSAGDAIGFPSLASTSMEQGRIAVCHAFKIAMPSAPDYFPYGIYAVPEPVRKWPEQSTTRLPPRRSSQSGRGS
jgi:NAD(P) transhydrogenase